MNASLSEINTDVVMYLAQPAHINLDSARRNILIRLKTHAFGTTTNHSYPKDFTTSKSRTT